jgi:hypothetical protein
MTVFAHAAMIHLQGVGDVTAPDGIFVPMWIYEYPQRRTVMSEIITVGVDLAAVSQQLV